MAYNAVLGSYSVILFRFRINLSWNLFRLRDLFKNLLTYKLLFNIIRT